MVKTKFSCSTDLQYWVSYSTSRYIAAWKFVSWVSPLALHQLQVPKAMPTARLGLYLDVAVETPEILSWKHLPKIAGTSLAHLSNLYNIYIHILYL